MLQITSMFKSPSSQTARRRLCVLNLSVRTSVRPSVTKLVHTIFWRRMNRLWRKLARVVHGATVWDGKLWGSGDQRSRSHEVEDRFTSLAKGSFLSSLGRV